MPQNINQPSNRIDLTNVSLVRYRKHKVRFELACYKNKLLEYRSGTETNLDNVLQVYNVFRSVSKGALASTSDLEKCFGKGYDIDLVIREILDKGENQVGAGERREERERLEREILDLVAARLVDPVTKRPYTTGMIKKALEKLSQQGGHRPVEAGLGEKLASLTLEGSAASAGVGNNGTATLIGEADEVAAPATLIGGADEVAAPATLVTDAGDEGGEKHKGKGKKADMPMWTGVVTTKSAKSQALEAIKALIAWQHIPVMRVRMKVRVTCPIAISKQAAKSKGPIEGEGGDKAEQQGKGTVKDRILSFVEQVESQVLVEQEWECIGFVEPGAFKGLGEFVSEETKGRGRVEVLDMAVTHED